MVVKRVVRICTMCFVALVLPVMVIAETAGVFFDSNMAQIQFEGEDIKPALQSKSFTFEMHRDLLYRNLIPAGRLQLHIGIPFFLLQTNFLQLH